MKTRVMPQIRPLSDLRASIGEITEFVDNEKTPVILTKHGHGKYVFLSIDEYGELVAKQELYGLLDEGLAAEASGDVQDFREAARQIREGISDEQI